MFLFFVKSLGKVGRISDIDVNGDLEVTVEEHKFIFNPDSVCLLPKHNPEGRYYIVPELLQNESSE